MFPRWLPLIGLPVLVVAVYFDTLDHPFVYDDEWNSVNNPAIQLQSFTSEALLRALKGHRQMRMRPVSNLGFALSHYAGGLHPRTFRAVNLGLHALNSLLVYLFLLQLLALAARSGPSVARLLAEELSRWRGIAGSLALLWALHPVHISAVTYIHQRMVLQTSCFMLLGLLVYLRARTSSSPGWRRVGYAGCVLLGSLALLSKETGALFAGAVLLVEWTVFQDMRRAWFWQRRRSWFAALLLLAVLGMIALDYHGWEWLGGRQPFWRILEQSRAMFLYGSLLVFPHPSRLSIDHSFLSSIGWVEPWTNLPALLMVLGLMGVGLWATRRHKLIAFGIFWWFTMHALESPLQGLDSIAEYRLYLASLGFLLAAQACFRTGPRGRRLLCLGLVVVAGVFGVWTRQQNQAWQSNESLWRDVLAKSNPMLRQTFRAHQNLGTELMRQGRLEEALPHLERATQLGQFTWAAPNALSSCLFRLGREQEALALLTQAYNWGADELDKHIRLARNLYRQGHPRHAWILLQKEAGTPEAQALLARLEFELGLEQEALARLAATIEAHPPLAENHSTLAELYARTERWQEARQQLEIAASLEPAQPAHRVTLGQVLLKLGAVAESRALLEQTVRAHPEYAEAHYQLGRVCELSRDHDAAEAHYRRALELGTEHAPAWSFLGRRAFARAHLDDAIQCFSASLRIDPQLRARVELAGALIAAGHTERGEAQLRAVLAEQPSHGKAHELLGVLFAQQGSYSEAVQHFEAALQERPGDRRLEEMLTVARERADDPP